jgi:hypothetical protein
MVPGNAIRTAVKRHSSSISCTSYRYHVDMQQQCNESGPMLSRRLNQLETARHITDAVPQFST